jgi:hypothetical protein
MACAPRTLDEHLAVFCRANGAPTLGEVGEYERRNEGKRGYSGSETMKLFRASSTEQEEDIDENRSVTEKVSEEYVERTPRPRDLDDESID